MARRRVAPAFYVLRRCPPGECDVDCNCHLVEHPVDVDELLPDELLHFQVAGDDAQRAEIATWQASDVGAAPTHPRPRTSNAPDAGSCARNIPPGMIPRGILDRMTWVSEGQRRLAGILERMTQEEVAERCDVEQPTVSRWRSGERTPFAYCHRAALAELGIPMGDWDRAPVEAAA